jgi:hypothetical protein
MKSLLFSFAFAIALVATTGAFADSGLTNVGGGVVDVNDDGVIDVSNDGSAYVGGLSTDLVGPGLGIANYNPLTGHVLISTNGAGFIEVNSSTGQFIIANLNGTSPPNTVASDPFTANQINYLGFTPLGSGGILNNWDLGAILPLGLTGSVVANANFRWTPTGGGDTLQGNINIVPEPSSFVLAGLASVGMLYFARRRRTA